MTWQAGCMPACLHACGNGQDRWWQRMHVSQPAILPTLHAHVHASMLQRHGGTCLHALIGCVGNANQDASICMHGVGASTTQDKITTNIPLVVLYVVGCRRSAGSVDDHLDGAPAGMGASAQSTGADRGHRGVRARGLIPSTQGAQGDGAGGDGPENRGEYLGQRGWEATTAETWGWETREYRADALSAFSSCLNAESWNACH
eukprot:357500-Chlamydomonas_euryale.AAC.7